MKISLTLLLSISFLSAASIFVSCSKKKDDPAPANTTTSGTTTSGSTTSATTSGSTTSGAASTGSFDDGTTNYVTAYSHAFTSPSDNSILTIDISPNYSTYIPIVILSLKKPVTTGTFTTASSASGGISYGNTIDDYYHSNNGGSISVTITSISATQIEGTFTLVGKTYTGLGTKNVTGSFNAAISTTNGSTTSGSTSSGTTSSTTINSAGTGTGSYNDGSNHANASAIVFSTSSDPNALYINLDQGGAFPRVMLTLKSRWRLVHLHLHLVHFTIWAVLHTATMSFMIVIMEGLVV